MTTSIIKDELEHWYEHIARFVSSGKTQKEYCLANGLDYSQFKKWRYKFSDDFPVNQEHPRTKRRVEQTSNIKIVASSTPVPRTIANNFVSVDVVDDCPDKILIPPTAIKMYLKSNIYLELTADMDTTALNKIFTALEVL